MQGISGICKSVCFSTANHHGGGSAPLGRGLHGFTLIELLVVVAIIALLVAILLPALSEARDLAKTTACLANEHQIGLAMATYQAAWDGHFAPSWSFPPPVGFGLLSAFERLEPYMGGLKGYYWGDAFHGGEEGSRNRTSWICPSDPVARERGWWRMLDEGDQRHGYWHIADQRGYVVSYAISTTEYGPLATWWGGENLGIYNLIDGQPRRASEITDPSRTLMFTDTAHDRHYTFFHVPLDAGLELEPFHEGGKAVNILLCDGHAETFSDLRPTMPPYNRLPWSLPKYLYIAVGRALKDDM